MNHLTLKVFWLAEMMSNTKRKRESEDSQTHKDGHPKEKKRRKSGVTPTAGTQATSGSRSNVTNKKIQASATTTKQSAKTQAQQRGPDDNHKILLNGDGASRGPHTGEKPVNHDPGIVKDSVKAIPDDQAGKAQKRKEIWRQEKKKETENTKSQQHDRSQNISNAVKKEKLKEKKKKKRKSSNAVLGNTVAKATAVEQIAKELKRRLWPIKHKKEGHKLSLAEKKARRATKDQKKLAKRDGRRQKQKSSAPVWRISEAIGGRMLSIDPIFSPEEE